MYHGKTSNNCVDCVQEMALRILHNDFNMSLEALLTGTDEQTVHSKNMQTLIIFINFKKYV